MNSLNPIRLHGLDTLRTAAIVAVAIFHLQPVLPGALQPVKSLGWMGVDLFFALSGFLIGSQLLMLFVSAVIRPGSIAEMVIRRAFEDGVVLTSSALFAELSEVLQRAKFERGLTLPLRQSALAEVALLLKPIEISAHVTDCRDADDDKLLELALSGDADAIVTGDKELLCLHPWRGIAILTPADYIAQAGGVVME